MCSESQAGTMFLLHPHGTAHSPTLGKLRPEEEQTASQVHKEPRVRGRWRANPISSAGSFWDLSAEQAANSRGVTFGGYSLGGRDQGFIRFSKYSSSSRGLWREPQRAPERV